MEPNLGRVLEGLTPWGRGPGALEVIRRWLGSDEPEPCLLPDEAWMETTLGIPWGPGAADGVALHHERLEEDRAAAESIYRRLVALCTRPGRSAALELYDECARARALRVLDPLLESVTVGREASAESVLSIGAWLSGGADREAVKIGVGLIGLFEAEGGLPASESLRGPLIDLGRHDEFTYYVMLAIERREESPLGMLCELARQVGGWGRVHLVPKLIELADGKVSAELRAWLLTEGFRNGVMDAYLALSCAEGADLAGALSVPIVPDELLRGARDLMSTLCELDGPGGDLRDFEGGKAVVERLLDVWESGPARLEDLALMSRLLELMADRGVCCDLEQRGWKKAAREELRRRCAALIQQPVWFTVVEQSLVRPELPLEDFLLASELGESLGVDVWAAAEARLRANGSCEPAVWWRASETEDEGRLALVAELARERLLPLGSGVDFGPAEQALMAVVARLDASPGVGEALVAAALDSGVVPLRNGAASTLESWGTWSAETERVMRRVAGRDAEAPLRARLEGLLRRAGSYD